jgi:hypothetical protein
MTPLAVTIMFEDLEKHFDKITHTDSPLRHKYYKETVDHAKEMGVHVEGNLPKTLLEEKRPNEPEEVREYRIKVWKAVTASLAGKIINTVSKIFDPKLFRVDFGERPTKVPEAEDLGEYLTKAFGIWKSMWVYIRETDLVKDFSDPNSLCLIMPENPEAEEGEYYRPIPKIFKAEYLVDFIDDLYYIIWIPEVEDKKGLAQKEPGKLWLITAESIQIWKVVGQDRQLVFELPTGFMPAFRLGGQVKGDHAPYWFKSFIGGVAPHWDKVVNMVSDLDGATVNHLFPSMWEYQVTCKPCEGSGEIKLDSDNTLVQGGKIQTRQCGKCKGSGQVTNKSPFGIYTIKRDAINPELPPPTPPAQYITKDIAPLQELKLSIEDEILAGFSSVNMEILHKVGENQSGIAKVMDRSDLESFLHRVLGHIFDCNVHPLIIITARWRYGVVLEPKALEDYIDGITISKPKELSVVGVNFLMEELKAALGGGTSGSRPSVSNNYIRQIESEIINNRFANNEQARKKNLAIIQLKPFPNKSAEDVSLGVVGGTIRKIDAIRNDNIDDLVTLSIDKDENFLELSTVEQIEAIDKIIAERHDLEEPVEVAEVIEP